MLWEYDCSSGKIFIHYDLIAKAYENSSYTVNELIRLFKNEFHISVNELIRDKYLNEKYLKSFFEENKSYEEFEIQFATDNSGLIWYCVRVERIADVIIVSGKNMYNEFKERSIYNSVKGSFENVTSIDVRIGSCVVVHSKRTLSHPAKTYDYNNTMKMFVDKYTAEDDKESLKNELSLDYVVKRLEEENVYNIYVNVISASDKKSCKKVTFSYTDKSKSFITFSTVNMDEIVTRYERMLKDLKRKSRNDMLTGVYNRNFYESNIKNQSFTGGVAIFDIDNFKLCNDTKGHGAGDELLVRVSQIIKSEITDNDKLIRYGGDEFLLLIPGASSSALEKTLNRIQKSVRNSNLNETDGFTLSLSVGGVIAKNETAEEAAYRADRLMYRAKSKKNAVVTEQNQFAYNGGECYGSAQKILIADASVLHDIGKIEIDSKILNKPGRLTPKEREEVKKHAVIGEEILLNGAGNTLNEEPMLATAAQICRWHHERYDGGGYPDGLSGDNIPIAAQVVSIAVVYDALVCRRVYKEAYSGEKALDMILSGECGSFNPILLECLCDISGKLIKDIYADKYD